MLHTTHRRLEKRLRRLDGQLSEDHAWVVESLAAHGHRGRAGSQVDNPLTSWLRHSFRGTTLEPLGFRTVRCADLDVVEVCVTSLGNRPIGVVKIPRHVAGFLSSFHQGLYPGLEM